MSGMSQMVRFKVSVRALAAFNQIEGDLISSARPSPSAFEGQHTHRLVQDNRPDHTLTEVGLSAQWLNPDFELLISGRADCIVDNLIEEIKTSRIPPEEIAPSVREQHQMQARIYGALFALQHPELDELITAVSYVHPQTLHQWQERHHHTRETLIEEFMALCARYDHWLQSLYRHRQVRHQWLGSLTFPYPSMRAEQRLMAETVYKACHTGKHLTVEAPTGTGKTLAALFPALKAMPNTEAQSLFFLTMKTTGRDAAEQALSAVDPEGQLSTVFLSAKSKVCLSPDTACDGLVCSYAKDYFAKREKVWPQLLASTRWSDDALTALAQEQTICPYYLAQDWASWADVVVADINYIYDTTAVQPYLLREIDNQAFVLIDECHNLIDRGRMIFSDTFSGLIIQQVLKETPSAIQKEVRKLQSQLRKVCKGQDGTLSHEGPQQLCAQLREFVAKSPILLRENPSYEPSNLWQELIFACARFARLNELANDTDFRWRYQDGATIERQIELICLDPSPLLQQKHDLVHNVIGFSATLQPWHYSNQLNGLTEAVTQQLPSPFQPEQFQVYLANDVSTRFRDRQLLAGALKETLQSVIDTHCNSMVFFSSYQQLCQCTRDLPEQDNILIQHSGWSATERERVLQRMRGEQGLTLMTVLGGVFAEGIDLPGVALEQVVIVGPGLPQVNDVNNAIRERMDQQQVNGFEYAYVFPGLQKVLQAAGRCVRTESDRGDILLIDDRFPGYLRNGWLPEHWSVSAGPLANWRSGLSMTRT